MLTHPGRRHAVGHLLYDYDALPILIQECPCVVWARATGSAHVAYDGQGAWWCEQIEFSSPRHPGPLVYLAVSDPMFAEIAKRLTLHRAEDIGERIGERLVHHARELPRVPRPALWRAVAAEMACVAGIIAAVLCASLPAPHAAPGATTVAHLEMPEDRP